MGIDINEGGYNGKPLGRLSIIKTYVRTIS